MSSFKAAPSYSHTNSSANDWTQPHRVRIYFSPEVVADDLSSKKFRAIAIKKLRLLLEKWLCYPPANDLSRTYPELLLGPTASSFLKTAATDLFDTVLTSVKRMFQSDEALGHCPCSMEMGTNGSLIEVTEVKMLAAARAIYQNLQSKLSRILIKTANVNTLTQAKKSLREILMCVTAEAKAEDTHSTVAAMLKKVDRLLVEDDDDDDEADLESPYQPSDVDKLHTTGSSTSNPSSEGQTLEEVTHFNLPGTPAAPKAHVESRPIVRRTTIDNSRARGRRRTIDSIDSESQLMAEVLRDILEQAESRAFTPRAHIISMHTLRGLEGLLIRGELESITKELVVKLQPLLRTLKTPKLQARVGKSTSENFFSTCIVKRQVSTYKEVVSKLIPSFTEDAVKHLLLPVLRFPPISWGSSYADVSEEIVDMQLSDNTIELYDKTISLYVKAMVCQVSQATSIQPSDEVMPFSGELMGDVLDPPAKATSIKPFNRLVPHAGEGREDVLHFKGSATTIQLADRVVPPTGEGMKEVSDPSGMANSNKPAKRLVPSLEEPMGDGLDLPGMVTSIQPVNHLVPRLGEVMGDVPDHAGTATSITPAERLVPPLDDVTGDELDLPGTATTSIGSMEEESTKKWWKQELCSDAAPYPSLLYNSSLKTVAPIDEPDISTCCGCLTSSKKKKKYSFKAFCNTKFVRTIVGWMSKKTK